MIEKYNKNVIQYFVSELETNKQLGIVSKVNTGKTILGIIIMIEQMRAHRQNGFIVVPEYSNVVYIYDKIISILFSYDIKCEISNDTNDIRFEGLTIRQEPIHKLTHNYLGYDKNIVLIDDSSLMNNSVQDMLNMVLSNMEYTIFTDNIVIKPFEKIKTIDHLTINNNVIRSLKINKLLNK